ncbi:hypothetical protein ACJJTC_005576 [Scirpophaga incertulas]
MSQSQDEARAARIQKYKEDRRKQLTARTATLFSANVTERRPRKVPGRSQSDDNADHLKSSSEMNINSTTTSVPIRTTRTSRLRAAAACQSDSLSPRKSNRSSSVQSLLEDVKKTTKYSKIIDRDKQRLVTNRKQSNEREIVRKASGTCNSDKEIGAIKTKPEHSTNKIVLEKVKDNISKNNSKENIVDVTNLSKNEETTKKQLLIDTKLENFIIKDEPIFNDILNADKELSDSLEKGKIEDLFNNLAVNQNIECNLDDDVIVENGTEGLKISHKDNIPKEDIEVNKIDSYVKLENSGVVPKIVKNAEVGGLLGAVCVRKVERFSELLSNLCSPCEADILFEDLLVENGIDGNKNMRNAPPECTPPCRRAPAQALPRVTSTPTRVAPALPSAVVQLPGEY